MNGFIRSSETEEIVAVVVGDRKGAGRTVADDPHEGALAAMVGAGFWRRLAAWLLDGLVLAVVSGVIVLGLWFVGGLGGERGALFSYGPWFGVLSVAYFSFMESSALRATLGKMAVGVLVVDEHGRRLTVARAMGRTLAKTLNWITLGLGYAAIGFVDGKRGLHDVVAGTRAIATDPQHPETPQLAWTVIGLCGGLLVLTAATLILATTWLVSSHPVRLAG